MIWYRLYHIVDMIDYIWIIMERMWDILYFCRNFVLTDDECDQVIIGELQGNNIFIINFFFQDYFNAQTYDENLTLETLQEQT